MFSMLGNFSLKEFVKSSRVLISFPLIFKITCPSLKPVSNADEFASTLVITTPFFFYFGGRLKIEISENAKTITKSQIFQCSFFIF